MNKSILFLLASILFFASCKRQQINQTTALPEVKDSLQVVNTPSIVKDSVQVVTSPNNPVKAGEMEEEKVKIDEIDFKYLKAKSKVLLKTANDNFDASANIRIQKDSIIWLSVSWGIVGEVVRAYIKPDSIFLYQFNKKTLKKEYHKYSFDDLSKDFNFNLNFNIIQSAIIGSQPIKKKYKVSKEKGFFLLKQKEGKVTVDNYVGEFDRKLKKVMLEDQLPTQRKMTLDFEDFTTLNQYLFPYTSVLTLDVQSPDDQKFYQTLIQLKHTKVELSDTPLEFPFKFQ
ncbi:uncharacterized protein DUF4292 [Arcicella aurantiaca]|uniref:Uncharacterized protein DUF4292 n=1 Tax=Arcicella aurantiaca TaxID=591202 RepID=A0A316ECI6_9BACT|nr:DUF4292 domain-containing protein [Arcicella aurantiaca]PWK27333.1 uncharacterized protein DUF4292 [Arcicella aurantiaca]